MYLTFDAWPEETPVDEDALLQALRDFADWIYRQLEAEHDYTMSDESVDAGLEDDRFDEFGVMI